MHNGSLALRWDSMQEITDTSIAPVNRSRYLIMVLKTCYGLGGSRQRIPGEIIMLDMY